VDSFLFFKYNTRCPYYYSKPFTAMRSWLRYWIPASKRLPNMAKTRNPYKIPLYPSSVNKKSPVAQPKP